ncbi:MAG TPA: substrate-binding domain-containing protein [Thermoanaerobaculia bacterium]|nr:substrate-binding domain-containing protein [Thermoanaerobaculia bacterium]
MRRIAVLLLLALSFCAKHESTEAPPASTAAKTSYTIAVVPQGTTHEFWKSIHAGAVKAARDASASGVEVHLIWKGPVREDDREQQVQVVEGFLTQGVNGIVLAPFDKNALVRPVEEASRSGIPTVVIDSGLESTAPISFVASNNYHGGELAADEMGRLLNGKGKVLVLRYQEGVFSTEQREKGFVERIKSQFPGIELVSSNQFAGATRDTAKSSMENLLNRYGDQLDGVFTPNESSTAGSLLALEDAGKAGKIRFLGFDTSDIFVQAMRDGKLHGIVVQNPFAMGELGVKTLLAHLAKKPAEKRVDTGVTLITPATLDAPQSQTLLHPPLDQYLK